MLVVQMLDLRSIELQVFLYWLIHWHENIHIKIDVSFW